MADLDFGFSRFLEVFEERFGRPLTTVLVGTIGFGLLLFAIKTIFEMSKWFYKEAISYPWLSSFNSRTAAIQLIVLAAQIFITFVVLTVIWRFFLKRKLNRFHQRMNTMKTDIERLANNELASMHQQSERVRGGLDAAKTLLESMIVAMTLLRTELRERDIRGISLDTLKYPLTEPPPTPAPQDTPKET